ncbi:hypothetical protein MPEAHAMD_7262 [Methylobacterium frigidaeris]|uniref:Uncharacterized protein n=1 Tax=Methylobacterium frigidaeris TaxID=2038277 RepID=A0AA37M8S5_9HYPH|nr:hypothetical protein MPEAHAMD_7262 [Methylobacterium frigidaeris]
MPKSYGKLMPSGRTILNWKAPSASEKAYLFGLPFGVSTTTCTWPSSEKVGKRLGGGAVWGKCGHSGAGPATGDRRSVNSGGV